MTDKDIKKILKDLYKLEPSLQSREGELLEIIKEFSAAKPDTKFDLNFKNELKREILGRFIGMMPEKFALWEFMKAKKLPYAIAGFALLVIIAVPLAYSFFNNKPASFDFGFSQNVKNIGNGAFGNLLAASGNGASAGMAGAEEKSQSLASPMDASAGISYDAVAMGMGGGGGTASSARMIFAPEAASIVFKYIGDDLNLADETVSVLRREKNGEMAKKLGRFFANTNLGMLSLAKFKNLEAQNLSLVENRDEGYAINFDVINENIAISQNWSKWPVAFSETIVCPPGAKCVNSGPLLQEKDVPSDEALIGVSNNFLDRYGINRSVYGTPEVDHSWNRYYIMAKEQNDAAASIPEEMSIVYPLLLNGREVYEQYGGKVGLRVSINIRTNKINSVFGLETQNYSSSDYTAETDAATIVKFAEAGGTGGAYYYGGPQKTIALELLTPQIVYVRQWQYAGNANTELFVPSLFFKIKNLPVGIYYDREYVTVPLVKELLGQVGGGEIRPMPMQVEPSAVTEPSFPEK